MSRLRVLIPALSAKSYGGDSYFRSILPVLAKRVDIETIVVAPDDRFAGSIPVGGSVRLIRAHVPCFLRGPARVAWEQISLPRLARRYGASVVYTANNSGVLTSGIPCVVAIRNMEPLVPLFQGTPVAMRIKRALLARFTAASARSAARVVAVSNRVREAVEKLGVSPDRIDVIYHGVDDLSRPDPGSPRRGGFMATAAKFVRYANLETMLRAFSRLKREGYGGELRMAGGPHDRAYEREIRALTASLGLADRVRYLGYRPRAEVHELMRHADAFLFPSVLESCPFTLLEAMSQGAAIVTTTAPPMPEFAGDGAILVSPQDDAAFAQAARRAMSDHDLRARALARAGAFRWDDSVDRLVKCLRRASGD